MNIFFQLCGAALFLLWDRGRLLRGAWRRREWRNIAVHGFWLALALLVALAGPVAVGIMAAMA
jgi:hypothetical protein